MLEPVTFPFTLRTGSFQVDFEQRLYTIMSYITRVIAKIKWGKVAKLLGFSIGAGLLLIYVLSLLFKIGPVVYLLGMLLASVVSDFAMAWESETAIAAGKVKLQNEIVGNFAIANEDFSEQNGQYKGKVRIGFEYWEAVSDSRILSGSKVRVSRRDGLTLNVETNP
jgi:membrane protein implicated in regulation of membrane protease activity